MSFRLALTILLGLAGAGLASAQAAPRPLLTEPEVRWSFGPFAFEGPPLVAGDRVLAAGRDATSRRALVVLDRTTGRVLARSLFPSPVALEPAASGERVALRVAEQRVDVLRWRGARLVAERSLEHAPSLSAPLFAGEDLVLRQGPELARQSLQRSAPSWTARVPGAFTGTPAVQGERVFATWYDGAGMAHLALLDAGTGELLADAQLGRHRDARVPDASAPVTVVPQAHDVFVALPLGVPATSGGDLSWVRVARDGDGLGKVTLHDFLAPPLETAEGWVAPERTRDGVRWLLARATDGRERAVELAAPAHHAWLSACTTRASRAGDVLYLGPCAADARTLQVLWRRASAPCLPAVPAPEGLLVIEGDVLRLLGGPAESEAPGEAGVRELVTREERALGERLVQLGVQALRGGDGELARGYALEAEGLGTAGRALEMLRTGLEHAPTTTPDPRRRAALQGEERAARTGLPAALADAAHAASDPAARLALLGELLRRAPEDERGRTELARLLPEGAQVGPGEGLAWLEFLALGAQHPFTLLDGPGASAPEQRRLADEREAWRADARGFESERLLVVTAGARPDAVARTLRSGELVCDVLEELFGGARGGAGRLELVLYPTREEYLAHSGSDLGGLESVLGFTAGHFDLAAEVSRLYLPPADERDARLLAVSAHELAHHWLAVRSRFGPPRASPATSGFWIVEAIATWVEELELDVARRTWRPRAERAPSVDTVRNARGEDLLAWPALLALSFEEYTKLEARPTCSVSLDWQLGTAAPRGPLQLFYAQGGALAHYLYEGDGGAHRALLFRAVEAYYRGQPLDLPRELGTGPEELGERVREFARGK